MYLREIQKYDGSLLHQRFAFKYFRDQVSPIGNIIAFRGPMEVLADHMIDQEDVLSEAFIYSDDAINFLWEMPTLGNNAFGAVAYQRLFNTMLADLLSSKELLSCNVIMDGDDIMVANNGEGALGKCSVSITHVNNGAALGHTGINITAGSRAPAHACSTGLNEQQINVFIEKAINAFNTLNQDVFVATAKILV